MSTISAQRHVDGDRLRPSRHVLYKDGATLHLHRHILRRALLYHLLHRRLMHRTSFIVSCTNASYTSHSLSVSYAISPSAGSD
jgi:hypothetical protein